MSDLFLELFSEEIPARFQRRAAEDLKKAVTNGLVEAGLVYESAAAFVTPRRLALTVMGVPDKSPDAREERKGPRVGAPPQALEGFLKAAGLTSIEQAKVETDPKKGDFYVAVIQKQGAPAIEILSALLPKVIADFPWPKSMRWGAGRTSWVRPLRAITATFGSDTDEVQTVPFEIEGLAAGRTTFGHRFMAPQPIEVKRFDDYVSALEKAKVVLDLDKRKAIIEADAQQLAFAQGLDLIADQGLLEEVAGLVEWPVVMMGSFEEEFLAVPAEAIIATIRANQKCFCVRDRRTGKLANRFVLTANTIAADDGKTIVAGNERVIRARLSDAKFFYQTDLERPLEEGLPKLNDMVFHAKLGTQAERGDRLVALAEHIAPLVNADVDNTRRAARLAKADLVTQMVGEFPELQGMMGRYYAAAQGEPTVVANAIAEHYKPVGPSDTVPTDPVAIAVALADKLDLLVSFWAIDEKPTGSRDPFALRRAALGVIRIITENRLRLPLRPLLVQALWKLDPERFLVGAQLNDYYVVGGEPVERHIFGPLVDDLLDFIHDRLKVVLKDQGARHDLVDAVITDKSDDLLKISQRVQALAEFLSSDDGKNLLAGYRRAVNIVVAEEKKDGTSFPGDLELGLLKAPEETALARAVEVARAGVLKKTQSDNYAGAMSSLATLRAPVDAFFEAVMVNDPEAAIRVNRLNLLARLRDTMHVVADFSRIAG